MLLFQVSCALHSKNVRPVPSILLEATPPRPLDLCRVLNCEPGRNNTHATLREHTSPFAYYLPHTHKTLPYFRGTLPAPNFEPRRPVLHNAAARPLPLILTKLLEGH